MGVYSFFHAGGRIWRTEFMKLSLEQGRDCFVQLGVPPSKSGGSIRLCESEG